MSESSAARSDLARNCLSGRTRGTCKSAWRSATAAAAGGGAAGAAAASAVLDRFAERTCLGDGAACSFDSSVGSSSLEDAPTGSSLPKGASPFHEGLEGSSSESSRLAAEDAGDAADSAMVRA